MKRLLFCLALCASGFADDEWGPAPPQPYDIIRHYYMAEWQDNSLPDLVVRGWTVHFTKIIELSGDRFAIAFDALSTAPLGSKTKYRHEYFDRLTVSGPSPYHVIFSRCPDRDRCNEADPESERSVVKLKLGDPWVTIDKDGNQFEHQKLRTHGVWRGVRAGEPVGTCNISDRGWGQWFDSTFDGCYSDSERTSLIKPGAGVEEKDEQDEQEDQSEAGAPQDK